MIAYEVKQARSYRALVSPGFHSKCEGKLLESVK